MSCLSCSISVWATLGLGHSWSLYGWVLLAATKVSISFTDTGVSYSELVIAGRVPCALAMSAIVASVARKSRNFFAAARFFALAFIPNAPLTPAGIQVSSGLSVAGSAWKLKVASLGAAVVIAAKVDDTETIPSASPFATRAVAFSYEVPSGVLWKQPAVFICSSFSSAIFHAELTKDALPAV